MHCETCLLAYECPGVGCTKAVDDNGKGQVAESVHDGPGVVKNKRDSLDRGTRGQRMDHVPKVSFLHL